MGREQTFRKILQVLLALAISALALVYSFRQLPVHQVLVQLRDLDVRWLYPYVGLFAAVQLVRAWRWQLLLRPAACLGFAEVNAANAVGLLAVTVLPARIGEAARPVLIAACGSLTLGRAVPSIILERLVDGAFTAVLLFLALLGMPSGGGRAISMRGAAALILLCWSSLIVSLFTANWGRQRLVGWLNTRPDHAQSSGLVRVGRKILSWVETLRFPKEKAVCLGIGFLTAVYWGLAIASLQALGASLGLGISLSMACAISGAITLGSFLPAGPGMAGTLQVGAALALSQFFPALEMQPRIAAFTHLLWASQLILQIAWGVLFSASPSIRRRFAELSNNLQASGSFGGRRFH